MGWESPGGGRGCSGGAALPGAWGYSEGGSTARRPLVYSGKSCKERDTGLEPIPGVGGAGRAPHLQAGVGGTSSGKQR